MDHDHQAEEIRRAMAQVRRDVDANSAEVLSHAREMADWRYHVRKYPKLSLAAAAAIGYLLVPAIRKGIAPAQLGPVRVVGPANVEAIRQASLGEKMLSTAASMLLRNGVPLVTREVMRLWQQRAGRPEQHHPDSPLENPTSPYHQT
jgi:hypothetical protein